MSSIGWAVESMQAGYRVRRRGWNGVGMWCCLSPGMISCPAEKLWAPQNREYAEANGGAATVRSYVTMKCADGTIVPWVCSQSDLLAGDWEPAP
jgi:hypothetical protein